MIIDLPRRAERRKKARAERKAAEIVPPETIARPLRRYGPLDSVALLRLYRLAEGYSRDDYADPVTIQRTLDAWLSAPNIYMFGRDPKREMFGCLPNHNATCYQAHFVVREDARGGHLVNTLVELGRYMFTKTPCRAIIGYIEEENRGARSLLSQLGMKRIGVVPQSKQRGGKLRDEFIYYFTAAEFWALWGEEECLCVG